MIRKPIYIRSRNQITLPSEVVSYLKVGEGDYLHVEICPDGRVQLAPARLAVVGTAEAARQNEAAREDIKNDRFETFHDVDSFSRSLGVEELEPSAAKTSPPPLEKIEKEYIKTVLRTMRGNRLAAAKRLGWKTSQFDEKLKQFNLTPERMK